ncbi:MAG TPA: IgGFc-binding protein [Polyangia bacterium]|jgi:hypothetical protein
MRAFAVILSLAALGCGATDPGVTPPDGAAPDGPCSAGSCSGGRLCVPELGCVDCLPGTRSCLGTDTVLECNPAGHTAPVATCESGQTCVLGACLPACEAAAQARSNVGCEYWPVDLPNFCDKTIPMAGSCQREQTWAVLVANLNDYTVHVTLEQNDAAPGEAPVLTTVAEQDVGGTALALIQMPQREIDGSDNTLPDNFSALTSRAFRLQSSGPVVAYQLNTLAETDAIDASLLIPTSALDTRYRTISWPSVVLDVMGVKGRNRGFVTIIGAHEGTHVTVTAGGHIIGGTGVAETLKGGVVEADLGPFDVLHLAGHQSNMNDSVEGDLTGTVVTATRPVAVFAGAVCANVGSGCCCDHLEEQVPPASALGRRFAVTRSAPRGAEGDVWRILADKPGTTVATNLPAPWDSFTLEENEMKEFDAMTDFTVDASGPVLLAQFLKGQDDSGTGDPSLTFMPPVDQARKDYVFLVPATYVLNYAVIGRPVGTTLRIDGMEAPGEFGACEVHQIGALGGTGYESVRCPLAAGMHTLNASGPVTLIEYGYGPTGSIAYVGGADVKQINID